MIAGQSVPVDVSPFFRDPDGGTLTYAATSSDDAVLTVSLSGSTLTATAVAPGTATVTVTATDPDGLSAEQSVQVTVEAANAAPEAVGTIDAREVRVDSVEHIDLAPFFADADGDALAFSAASSAPDVASAAVSGDTLAITGVSTGSAVVTVTATDPGDLTAEQTVDVSVRANQAPEAVGTIDGREVRIDDVETIDLAPFFADADGDALTFSAASSAPDVATAAVSGDTLAITGVSVGSAVVTVTAADPDGLTAEQTVDVSVRPNQAPEAVGTIDARRIKIKGVEEIDLAPWFTDADGDSLAFSAESSAPEVATASVSGDTLTLTGVSTGSAVVTVTAADPRGLTATQSVRVWVRPNAAPSAVGRMPDYVMQARASVDIGVAPYFTDPDDDALTFSARSSAPDVVAGAVSGDTLTLTALEPGSAILTITAADVEGLTASQSTRITVEAAVPVRFRDDFDTSASLTRDWQVPGTVTPTVDNGVLNLTIDGSLPFPSGVHVITGPTADWTAQFSTARKNPETFAIFQIVTFEHRFFSYRLDVGSGLPVEGDANTNYRFYIFDGDACTDRGPLCYIPLAYGHSDAISDGPNEFTQITLSMTPQGRVEAYAGEEVLFTIDELDDQYPRAMIGATLWTAPRTQPGSDAVTTLWDWVDISGFVTYLPPTATDLPPPN